MVLPACGVRRLLGPKPWNLNPDQPTEVFHDPNVRLSQFGTL